MLSNTSPPAQFLIYLSIISKIAIDFAELSSDSLPFSPESQQQASSGWTCGQLTLSAAGVAAAVAAVAVLYPAVRSPAADPAGPVAVAQQDPGAGDMGRPVALSAQEQRLADRLFSQEGFNVVASDKVPFVRRLPDVRPRL